jgi:AraC-like DNA-binding protein
MDAMGALLDGPRAREAFLLRASMDPPWCLRVQDEAPLCAVALIRGTAWVIPDGSEAVALQAGDVALMRGPDHYSFADDPATPPQSICLPGQRTVTADGRELDRMRDLGVRTWGNSPDGATQMIIGTYQLDSAISQRVLRVLPALVVMRAGEWECPVLPLLEAEVVRDHPGQEAVLDRLLDLLLVAVLRAWLARPDAGAPAWYGAYGDPVVGRALRLLEHNPERQWTVASLAREVGASRAALARRFTELVGEPPMSFLTEWRIALAADLLLDDPGATIGSVAARVGYGSPYALSAAFKRVRGVSPREHRAAVSAHSRTEGLRL